MLYIDPKSRDTIELFQASLEQHLHKRALRRSLQRKRLLLLMHAQSYPIGMQRIMTLFKEAQYSYSYPTLIRHVNFFVDLGWLKVVGHTQRTFLLIRSPKELNETP